VGRRGTLYLQVDAAYPVAAQVPYTLSGNTLTLNETSDEGNVVLTCSQGPSGPAQGKIRKVPHPLGR